MMAMNEGRNEGRSERWPASLTASVLRVLLSVVLGVLALRGLIGVDGVVKGLLATDTLLGPWAWRTMAVFAANLLMFVGGIGGAMWLRPWKAISDVADRGDEDSPDTLKPAVLSALAGFLALSGLSAAAGTVGAVLFDPRIDHPVNWLTWAFLALFLLIGGGGLWGVLRLKPWAKREPISPSTRRTNTLFGLGGMIATVSCLAVIFDTMGRDGPGAFWSNSAVTPWVAVFAIVTWLLAWAISWLWYFSADEHEQRASDIGLIVGGFLFAVVTPAWWVAARAGLVPEPDAMVLWFVVNVVWTAGWFWRRNR